MRRVLVAVAVLFCACAGSPERTEQAESFGVSSRYIGHSLTVVKDTADALLCVVAEWHAVWCERLP